MNQPFTGLVDAKIYRKLVFFLLSNAGFSFRFSHQPMSGIIINPRLAMMLNAAESGLISWPDMADSSEFMAILMADVLVIFQCNQRSMAGEWPS